MSDPAELPDEIPEADALEQEQPTVADPPDEEAAVDAPSGVPLEANPPDWQEQREIVDLDPEEDVNRD
jgi:hypothetical protein